MQSALSKFLVIISTTFFFLYFSSMTQKISDVENDAVYVRENYLGKGAFSKSYVLKRDGRTYCGKFIPKEKTQADRQLESIQEFAILSKLQHPNIVNFVKCVETPDSYCLITEYYPHKSMFELIQRRSKLTIYEVRYFSKQLLCALKYLHEMNIVHRDIKPQNMLLDENLILKLSDFGMAIMCPKSNSIYKKHIYGTPNYISPEMIAESVTRYNNKVDIWAVGCFLYHMYTGRTPFRGKEEKSLYANIQNCSYNVPEDMPEVLSALLAKILQRNPDKRPNARQILVDDFYRKGFIPNSLPITALVEKPKFIVPSLSKEERNSVTLRQQRYGEPAKFCENKCMRRFLVHYDNHLALLISREPNETQERNKTQYHDIEHPMLNPLVWVKEVLKQNKNIGYTLNDGTNGVLFEDRTVLVLLPNKMNLYYVAADKQIKFYTITRYSNTLTSKFSILKSIFNLNFVSQKTCDSSSPAENNDWLPLLPYLMSYYETTKYFIILMSNGLYQVISKTGDVTLLLCMKTNSFSVLNKEEKLKTYDLNSLFQFQYPDGLHRSLLIASAALRRVLSKSQCFACRKEVDCNVTKVENVPPLKSSGNDKC